MIAELHRTAEGYKGKAMMRRPNGRSLEFSAEGPDEAEVQRNLIEQIGAYLIKTQEPLT